MLLAERSNELMPKLLERHAKRLEHSGGDAFTFTHETEEQMFGTHMAVAELARFVDRQLDDLLRPRRERDLTWRSGRIAAADRELDRGAHLRQLDSERVEDACRHALTLAHEAEQQVLRADVVVVKAD